MTANRADLPQPPEGLSDTALRQWWDVVETFDLEAHEEALLRECCRTLTTCDDLADLLAEDGLTSEGSMGQTVVHPGLLELRQQRLALARMYASLRLPEGEDDERPQRRGAARRLYAVGGRE